MDVFFVVLLCVFQSTGVTGDTRVTTLLTALKSRDAGTQRAGCEQFLSAGVSCCCLFVWLVVWLFVVVVGIIQGGCCFRALAAERRVARCCKPRQEEGPSKRL